jgi:two-component system, OmpR family, sensor histidine kinase KdpD
MWAGRPGAATISTFRRWPAYLWSTAAVAAATSAGRLFLELAPLPNISMIFLMAVLFSAVSFGIWPAVYASVLSFLAYNFFLIEPLYTLQIAQPHEFLALVVFLIVAIVTSALAGRVRDQALRAGERARAMRRLYEFTWRLSGFTGVHDVAGGAAGEIHTSLRRPVFIFLGRGDDQKLAAAWPPDDKVDPAVLAAARRAAAGGTGNEAAPGENGGWQFAPLRTQSGIIGVVAIAPGAAGLPLDGEARALLAVLTEQTAAALERTMLAQEMAATQHRAETERVRNLLLTSISHDFRTPLASILGSATSLIEFRHALAEADQASLLRDIKTEAEGLDDMVKNLLAMTRIDAGALELRRDWVDLREIAERVASAAKRRGAASKVVLDLPAELPMIAADALLVEQALTNVVGNAVTHTPPGSQVMIDALVSPASVALRVTDDGPGIPAETLPRVFEKFVRAPARSRADRGDGTGLGLAIAKGIATAHGGGINAQSPVANGRGTRITLIFPREAQ